MVKIQWNIGMSVQTIKYIHWVLSNSAELLQTTPIINWFPKKCTYLYSKWACWFTVRCKHQTHSNVSELFAPIDERNKVENFWWNTRMWKRTTKLAKFGQRGTPCEYEYNTRILGSRTFGHYGKDTVLSKRCDLVSSIGTICKFLIIIIIEETQLVSWRMEGEREKRIPHMISEITEQRLLCISNLNKILIPSKYCWLCLAWLLSPPPFRRFNYVLKLSFKLGYFIKLYINYFYEFPFFYDSKYFWFQITESVFWLPALFLGANVQFSNRSLYSVNFVIHHCKICRTYPYYVLVGKCMHIRFNISIIHNKYDWIKTDGTRILIDQTLYVSEYTSIFRCVLCEIRHCFHSFVEFRVL